MKRILYLATLLGLLATCALAQDLAAVARQQRAQKKNTNVKVITNDDLQSSGQPVSTPSAAPAASDTAKDTKKDEKTGVEADADKRKEFQEKADAIKKEIAQLQREIDVSEREYKLRAAVYYADAGNSLRDPKQWAEQERKYQADMADKKKALDDAKSRLAAVQDDATKAGVGNAVQ